MSWLWACGLASARTVPQAAWNAGITALSYRVTGPTQPIVPVRYIAESVLRVAVETTDDDHIGELLAAATEVGENFEAKCYAVQQWALTLSGFPRSGVIELPRRPVVSIDGFTYLDGDGNQQSLNGSPAEYRLVTYGDAWPAQLTPLSGSTFPTAGTYPDAVTITFTAGYEDLEAIPRRTIQGVALLIGELYKQRSLSVHGLINVPAFVQLDRFFTPGNPLGGIW